MTLWLYAFDVNGTLDYGDPRTNAPRVQAYSVARDVRRHGGWFGTCSGMSRWRQLQMANAAGVALDFCEAKAGLVSLMISIEIQLGREARMVYVGDNPGEDPIVARVSGARFIWAEEFANGWGKHGEGYIRRIQDT